MKADACLSALRDEVVETLIQSIFPQNSSPPLLATIKVDLVSNRMQTGLRT